MQETNIASVFSFVLTSSLLMIRRDRVEYKMNNELESLKLYSRLVGIQRGDVEDSKGWMVQID